MAWELMRPQLPSVEENCHPRYLLHYSGDCGNVPGSAASNANVDGSAQDRMSALHLFGNLPLQSSDQTWKARRSGLSKGRLHPPTSARSSALLNPGQTKPD
mmetsp:Transcript_69190/g.122392  ORF Transcript_69190/g.122392 Transcript_69190/m.122392 type:complete len:101 (-) Transcript_69190:60-362(-)